MRLMGIFDWWLAVLDFISKSVENPAPAANTEEVAKEGQSGAAAARTKVFLQVGLAVASGSVDQGLHGQPDWSDFSNWSKWL